MEIDETMAGPLRARAKRVLRARMRALRQALPQSALAKRSARIVEQVLSMPEFARAKGIGTFWPMEGRGEVDLREVDAAARRSDKRVFYPFVDADVGFREVLDVRTLVERGHGFCEPDPAARAAVAGDFDLVLVPALAVTEGGHRLGFGRGFYDRVLPRFCPPAISIAVAFDFQMLAELPVETHDAACDRVVTDRV